MESASGAAEERWASLCNCVVNFLLEERYHLTALELLQELQEDGRHAQALRLRSFFSDPALFPPDLVARASFTPPGADPQSLLEEKIAAEEKLALTEYDLRLAIEDLSRLKLELQKQQKSSPDISNGPLSDASTHEGSSQQDKRDVKISALGPLKDNERKDLNCAVKEYLLLAGYRLAAMTFIEEVPDQDLDVWTNSSACVPDALRRYYYQYLSSTTEAAEGLLEDESQEFPVLHNLRTLVFQGCDVGVKFETVKSVLLNTPNLEKLGLHHCKSSCRPIPKSKIPGASKRGRSAASALVCKNLNLIEIKSEQNEHALMKVLSQISTDGKPLEIKLFGAIGSTTVLLEDMIKKSRKVGNPSKKCKTASFVPEM